MTAITAEHVAIAELAVYIPTTLVTVFVVLRHGFHKQLGWIYLSIFCVVRVVGAVLQILSHSDPSKTDDLKWAIILQSVGLTPLILASLGLLKRICDETTTHVPNTKNHQVMQIFGAANGLARKILGIYSKKATAVSRRSRTIQLIHIPALIALILAISGGTDQASSNASDHKGGRAETRAAIILFLIIYLVLGFLWIITARDLGLMVPAQKRIYFAMLLALPFMAVRLLYSILGGFVHDPKFSIFDGSVSVRLWMATIEEFVVVFLYTILGIVTPKVTVKASGPVSESGRPVQGDPSYDRMGCVEAPLQWR
ncbi:hypothetical protein BJX63DRAFT_433322 [Aspergillus granulosus]|uniref:DUF7702 domain-containing protein n=1 Tax=Aspergillus granulosus TaxID=176169 RepID=A0ABR4H7P3_9EURO